MNKVVDIRTKMTPVKVIEGCPANTMVGWACFAAFMIFVIMRAMG